MSFDSLRGELPQQRHPPVRADCSCMERCAGINGLTKTEETDSILVSLMGSQTTGLIGVGVRWEEI